MMYMACPVMIGSVRAATAILYIYQRTMRFSALSALFVRIRLAVFASA